MKSLYVVAALLVGLLLYWQLAPTPAAPLETALPPTRLPQTQIALHLSEMDSLGLDFEAMLLQQRIEADIYLLPQTPAWQGQLRNVRIEQQGRWQALSQPIYFEVAVSNGLFGAVQWLGLPATHPLRRLDFWLAELGGANAELGPVTSTEVTRHYRYQPRGHWQTRRLLEQHSHAGTWQHQLTDEAWALLLDAKRKIQQLSSRTSWQLSAAHASPLTRTRQLNASRIAVRPHWPALTFPLDVNATAPAWQPEIAETQHLERLVALLQQTAPAPAELHEQLNQVSVDALSRLLHRYPASAPALTQFLHVIADYPEQQTLLQQLASRPVNTAFKVLLLQKLASLPHADRISIDVLTLASQSGNAKVRQAGLFGLASVLRQQPTLAGVIEPTFARALRQREQVELVLAAIARSGSRAFEQQAIHFSNDAQLPIRQAASALLALYHQPLRTAGQPN